MRRFHICFLVLTFLIGAAGLQPLHAQNPVEELEPPYEEAVDAWASSTEIDESPFHRQRLHDSYASMLQSGQVHAVVFELVAAFDNQDWGNEEVSQQRILRRLALFVRAVRDAMDSPGIQGPLDTLLEQDAFLRALNQLHFGLDSLQKDDSLLGDAQASGYFRGTPDEVMLFHWDQAAGGYILGLRETRVRQWRMLENTLSTLLLTLTHEVGQANVSGLQQRVERWDNFLNHGYSQLPWESLINGWLIPPSGVAGPGPPNHQWVIMHPSLGVELSTGSLSDTRVKEALHVEALGHIWYHGDMLDDYWGVSATISLRDDLDPGIGAMVHINRNWNLGITWHNVEDDPFLFFSFDLFQFARQEAQSYSSQYQQLRATLGLD